MWVRNVSLDYRRCHHWASPFTPFRHYLPWPRCTYVYICIMCIICIIYMYLGQDVLKCVGNLAVDYTVDVTSCHNCLHHLLMCTHCQVPVSLLVKYMHRVPSKGTNTKFHCPVSIKNGVQ